MERLKTLLTHGQDCDVLAKDRQFAVSQCVGSIYLECMSQTPERRRLSRQISQKLWGVAIESASTADETTQREEGEGDDASTMCGTSDAATVEQVSTPRTQQLEPRQPAPLTSVPPSRSCFAGTPPSSFKST